MEIIESSLAKLIGKGEDNIPTVVITGGDVGLGGFEKLEDYLYVVDYVGNSVRYP